MARRPGDRRRVYRQTATIEAGVQAAIAGLFMAGGGFLLAAVPIVGALLAARDAKNGWKVIEDDEPPWADRMKKQWRELDRQHEALERKYNNDH